MRFRVVMSALIGVCALGIILVILLALGVFGPTKPVCPEGQSYVFTHNLVVGRVIIPQYQCMEI